MYLIDTNVISEARKRNKANPDVRAFFARMLTHKVPGDGGNGLFMLLRELADETFER